MSQGIPIYQIDAFASHLFEGNPAAVCPLEHWLADDLMQSIAAENNLSETVFFVPVAGGFAIRWFTPVMELPLCGHATLAAAYVLFFCLDYGNDTISFTSASGELRVVRDGEWLVLDFPAQPPQPCTPPDALIAGLGGIAPVACLQAEDYIVVYEQASQVQQIEPCHALLQQLDLRGVIVTAFADHAEYDIVARFFAPKCGIEEDPVTGSAYTQLMPYWAAQLGRSSLQAKQLSPRTGMLRCRLVADRVHIAGRAIKFMQGEIDMGDR